MMARKARTRVVFTEEVRAKQTYKSRLLSS